MWHYYRKLVTSLVWLLAGIAGVCLIGIIFITGTDIVLRRFDLAVLGAVDLVQVLGCLCLVLSLPYTTAVKGHIAVEFLFRHFSRRGKIVADTCTRFLGMLFFATLAWQSFQYGHNMLQKNAMTLTLNIPLFWVYWVAGFSFCVVILVKFFHLAHPGKEMIRP
ncbi:MAG: TRAP transporter small permease subunit [Lentisphaeria bacterium]|nr:TRAP transporter small permease subunit [Lentisphaeria bacterium]